MRLHRFSVGLMVLLLVSLPLLASEHGGEGGGWLHVFGKILNSGLLWGILLFFIAKPAVNFFRERSLDEKNRLEGSLREKEEREKELAGVEARVSRLEDEVGEICRRFDREIENEGKRNEQQLAQDLERIKRFAELEIDSLYQQKLSGLKLLAAELATGAAREKAQSLVTPELQSRLVGDFIREMEERKP